MWKVVETKIEKARVVKTKERGKKGERNKKKRSRRRKKK